MKTWFRQNRGFVLFVVGFAFFRIAPTHVPFPSARASRRLLKMNERIADGGA